MRKTAFSLALAALVCCLVTLGSASMTQDVKLTASDAAAGSHFGTNVAVSGDTIVVGAYGAGNDYIGSAYVFKPDGAGGYDETEATASDGAFGDAFGTYVAVSGDTIVVGAYIDDDAGDGSGSAYVFKPDGAGGYDETKLTASDAATGDRFGEGVAVCGDTIVVGASRDDDGSGSAYVFKPDGAGGYDETKLVASDAAADDRFGWPVAVSGDTIVVGVWTADSNFGSAYVFTPDGAGGYDETKLTASDAAAGDYFGRRVAISGDTIVVGAYPGDTYAGSAYVFKPDGAGGYDETKLTASDAAAYDYFGNSMAVAGDTIVIGAPNNDDGGSDFGSAYVFTPDGAGGYAETKLTASDAAADDRFGASVAVSGDTIVVSAVRDDDGGSQSGSAYVFDLSNMAPTANAGPDQSIHAGDVVTLDGSASFDDNTATADLTYAWTLTVPAGSGSTAALSSASAMKPTFTADKSGTYAASLIVTDEAGLSSVADTVLISSTNLAPTAYAGIDLVVAVDVTVEITGTAADPEGDTLTYAWTITSAPTGSTATLSGATTLAPSLTPDEIGEYVLTLVASDPYDDSVADSMTLTAISGSDYAQGKLADAIDALAGFADADFDSAGHRGAMTQHIGSVVKSLQSDKVEQAIAKLQTLISRTDGCALRDAVDTSGAGRDWIVTCDAQDDLHPLLKAALDALNT